MTVAGLDYAAAQEEQLTILKLQRQNLEINGKSASVYAIVQPNGRRGLTFDYGAPFHVRVVNELSEPSLIHWHVLTPPFEQDGVPGLSGPAIPAGSASTYYFPQTFGGTYWMHSHYGLQEQQLLAAPLIIRYPNKYRGFQDVDVMLADFSFVSPQRIYESLIKNKSMTSGHSDHVRATQDAESITQDREMTMHGADNAADKHDGDVMAGGHAAITMQENTFDHDMADLNDVDYDAFLANNRTLSDPEVVTLSNDGRVLLRVFNGATMSNFHVDLGEIDGILVAVDGQEVLPVKGTSFPIAAGQRLDILLTVPPTAIAQPVFFKLEGARRRTGIVLARPGARVQKYSDNGDSVVPPVDLTLEKSCKLHGR